MIDVQAAIAATPALGRVARAEETVWINPLHLPWK